MASSDKWFPEGYSPNISTERWLGCLSQKVCHCKVSGSVLGAEGGEQEYSSHEQAYAF